MKSLGRLEEGAHSPGERPSWRLSCSHT